MDIYGDNGYIAIDRLKQSPFIFIIGARRTGKTYGVLKYMLKHGRRFLYLRRTTSELDVAMSERHFALKSMEQEGYFLKPEKDGKYMYVIKTTDDDPQIIASAISLTLVSKMRGYDASEITDIVYDEFIPEKHVARISHEGDAVLNMYETINSNRELEGKPPVRLWMLANSNNLQNEVLTAFGIRGKLENMMQRGQEYSEYRNMTLVLAMDSPISKQKANTALYQAIGGDNQYTAMALSNEFAYDDFSNIRKLPLIEYIPRCRIDRYVVYDHKSNGTVYIAQNGRMPITKGYDFSDFSVRAFRIANSDLIDCYIWGKMFFDSYDTKVAISKALTYVK